MLNQKPQLLIITLLLTATLMSCTKSVLSELELDAPDQLRVKVKIDEKRQRKKQLQVSIRDRTNHPVELGFGNVFVNGEPTEWSSRTVITTARGYNYRVPAGVDEFEITIYWNKSDSYTFMIDKDAGFPGFGNTIGWNISRGAERFVITPTPFADNRIVVEYDVMR